MTTSSILVIDDLPKNIQVLANILSIEGYNVEYSTNGEDALYILENDVFDLILLDVMMPGMDGFEVCEKIRENPKANETPVIFITANSDLESIEKGFEVGGVDYIAKPFKEKELLARVKLHIELKNSRDKLKKVNTILEEKVKERTLELQKANKELESLDQTKNEFIQMIGHEIRTPLNGIIGSLQLLKNRIDNNDLKLLLDILDSSVTRLEGFSYSALLISKLKTRKYKPIISSHNLTDIINHSLLAFSDRISDKQITIEKALPNELMTNTDLNLTHELFKKLLDNAINYSQEKGLIKISAEIKENVAYIKIQDDGKGFPKKMLENDIQLFQPGETHVNLNVGMSLYLSRLILETLNGKLKISNSKNGGAIVEVMFQIS